MAPSLSPVDFSKLRTRIQGGELGFRVPLSPPSGRVVARDALRLSAASSRSLHATIGDLVAVDGRSVVFIAHLLELVDECALALIRTGAARVSVIYARDAGEPSRSAPAPAIRVVESDLALAAWLATHPERVGIEVCDGRELKTAAARRKGAVLITPRR